MCFVLAKGQTFITFISSRTVSSKYPNPNSRTGQCQWKYCHLLMVSCYKWLWRYLSDQHPWVAMEPYQPTKSTRSSPIADCPRPKGEKHQMNRVFQMTDFWCMLFQNSGSEKWYLAKGACCMLPKTDSNASAQFKRHVKIFQLSGRDQSTGDTSLVIASAKWWNRLEQRKFLILRIFMLNFWRLCSQVVCESNTGNHWHTSGLQEAPCRFWNKWQCIQKSGLEEFTHPI